MNILDLIRRIYPEATSDVSSRLATIRREIEQPVGELLTGDALHDRANTQRLADARELKKETR